MRFVKGLLVAVLTLVPGSVAILDAQGVGDRSDPPRGEGPRLGILLGGAWANPSVVSSTKRRPMGIVSFRASWRIAGSGQHGLEYVVSFPALLVARSREFLDVGVRSDGRRTTTPLATAFGFGIEPVGFRGLAGVTPGVRLTGDVSGGILQFTSRVPVASGRTFNFTYSLGAGGEVDIGGGRTLTLGYRLLHYSNASSALTNPGVDNGVLYAGIIVSRRR